MAFQGKMSDNGEDEPQFIISDVKTLPQKNRRLLVWVNETFDKTLELLKAGVAESDGLNAFIVGKNSKIYPTGIRVSEKYVRDNKLRYTITV